MVQGIQIACHFAGFKEHVQLLLDDKRGDWFKFTLTASQAGCCVQAPMIVLKEHWESFLFKLECMEEKLELEPMPIVLYDFTCQNHIVIGSLVAHEGVMFLDVNLAWTGPVDEDDWGIRYHDRLTDRYLTIRREITDYPEKSQRTINSEELFKSSGAQLFNELSTSRRTNAAPPEPPYAGAWIRLAGLQFHRSQVPKIITQINSLL